MIKSSFSFETLHHLISHYQNTGIKACTKPTDDRYQYKADGVLRLFGRKQLEILLLEASNEFGCHDKGKICFDLKATFGGVAMLKTIADYYPYASVAEFGKVKVFFLHAAGDQLHLWSLCYKQDGVYDLWRETFLTITPEFEDKADLLPDLLRFFWMMK
ncbi:hypothetical protein DFQ28_004582 [Apophysomyces sp. BC1034]|nr:hypothetical protein DFQ29_004008 [Apophysomyces sp. BC1021]KAG0188619.1 hypothetical protein DFQ28_004582 [Apophysomyces sp. BC1034]